MTNQPKDLWPADPHTLAKLEILKHYLAAWFSILYGVLSNLRTLGTLTYVDACCGPGRYLGGEDGSPIVALKAASAAINPNSIRTDFFFIDRERKVIQLLQGHVEELNPASHLVSEYITGKIDEVLPRLLTKLRSRNVSNSFNPMFFFIDGFGNVAPMEVIWRILEAQSTELFVFFNLMDVCRNKRQDHERERMVKVFGTERVLSDE